MGLGLLLLQAPLAMLNIAGGHYWLLPLNVVAALIGVALMLQDAL